MSIFGTATIEVLFLGRRSLQSLPLQRNVKFNLL